MRDVTEFHELQVERNKVQMMKFLHTTVSHDMMTPISNITFFATQMLKAGKMRNIAELEKNYEFIEESIKLVSCRMKDLLDQGLIDHGSFVPNEVEFTPREAVSQMAKILRKTARGVKVTEGYCKLSNNTCIGDVARIQQVLLNLTSNARKFVPKIGGKIQITTELTEMEGRHFIQIVVMDNGQGISLEGQEKLFKPFSKLEEHQGNNRQGHGFGLNICKMICTSLGGDIVV